MRAELFLVALAGCTTATKTADSNSALERLKQAPQIATGEPAWNADKDALIAFGASWCEPCWYEWTELKKAELPSDLVVYIVLSEPAGEGRSRVLDWAARNAPNFVLLADERGDLATAWEIQKLPALFAWGAKTQRIAYSHQAYSPGVVDEALASLRAK